MILFSFASYNLFIRKHQFSNEFIFNSENLVFADDLCVFRVIYESNFAAGDYLLTFSRHERDVVARLEVSGGA